MEDIDPAQAASLGSLLRRFRLAGGLTQEALADRSGVSARTIQDVERGLRLPHADTARRLGRALELTGERLTQFETAVRPRPRRRGAGSTSRSTERSQVALLLNPSLSTAPTTPPTNLPHLLSSFIGREADIPNLRQHLERSRLVTLTGAGGVGKTRLAIEVARNSGYRFTDGIWFVDFAPLVVGDFVPGALADVLRVQQAPNRSVLEQLVGRLYGHHALLIFDNCEHLIDDAARLIRHLLAACPNVAVLATSREALRLRGEKVYRVTSLAIPPRLPATSSSAGEFASVRLFAERAEEMASLSLSDANLLDVERICRAVDGIPLALELAAARLTSMTVAQISARLGEQAQLLTQGDRTAAPRQQTMRATIDWSYRLLVADDQYLWRQLSVFAGGFTLEAAEKVSNVPTPDILARLVDKSLVILDESESGARYRMLEPLRQYASETLAEAGEAEGARSRHFEWCLALAEQWTAQVFGPRMGPFLRRLAAEHDNMRLALGWCLDRDFERGLRLSVALGTSWGCLGLDAEAIRWHDAFLARSSGDSPNIAWALFHTGYMSRDAGYHALAIERLRKSYEMASRVRDRSLMSWSAVFLGESAMAEGDLTTSRSWLDVGIRLARQVDDEAALASGLCALARLARREGNYAQSRVIIDELLHFKWIRSRGVWYECALDELGGTTHSAGDPAGARDLFDACLPHFREANDRPSQGQALAHLGYALGCLGEYRKAREAFVEALGVFREIGQRPRAAGTLLFQGMSDIREGKHARGITLLAAAEVVPGFFLASLDPAQRADHDQRLDEAHLALSDEAFDKAWRKGLAMSVDEAVGFGLS